MTFLPRAFILNASKPREYFPPKNSFSDWVAAAQAKSCSNVLVFPLFDFNGGDDGKESFNPPGITVKSLALAAALMCGT